MGIKLMKKYEGIRLHADPLLGFSPGSSLITLLDLPACGWDHYPSMPTL